MAVSRSVTYLASHKAVWRAVMRLVQAAGYEVAETSRGAGTIVYYASGGMVAWKQEVLVSVTEVGDEETAVTVHVQAAGQATLMEGRQQRKLTEFVLSELDKQFERGEESRPISAPGTAGCFGVVLLILGTVVSRLV